MSESSPTSTLTRTWVAHTPTGVVGSVHRTADGFAVKRAGHDASGTYPTLEVAMQALHASLGPGAERPDFVAH
jgi:hypothetical protein